MSNTVPGSGAPRVAPDLINYANSIAQTMSDAYEPARHLAGDQFAAGANRHGSAPGATVLLASPPPTAPAPQELFVAEDGRLYGADQQPYLGQELYIAQDEFGNQVVVDGSNQIVDLDALEAAFARGELRPQATAAPPTHQGPPPPQFYLGQNNQIVDGAGNPYLGVTMYLQQDAQGQPLVIDAQGQLLDFDGVIASAGYDPVAEPMAEQPGSGPFMPGNTGTPATGSVNPGGYLRNTAALLTDLWRKRAGTVTPLSAATQATVASTTARTSAANTAAATAQTVARTLPLRDAKGRFVARTVPQGTPPQPGPRTLPLRDAKGRFVSPSRTTAQVQMRDAQGRFIKPHKSVTASINPPHGPLKNDPKAAPTPGATTGSPRTLPPRDAKGRFVSPKTPGTTQPGAGAQQPQPSAPNSTRVAITSRIIPAALLANDAYNLYQGIKHWDDEGNERKWDDAMRIGGSAVSAIASAQALKSGNMARGVTMHMTGLALNTFGMIFNDRD